jgi:coenzyme F420-reducing hydrogenase beta subunit
MPGQTSIFFQKKHNTRPSSETYPQNYILSEYCSKINFIKQCGGQITILLNYLMDDITAAFK